MAKGISNNKLGKKITVTFFLIIVLEVLTLTVPVEAASTEDGTVVFWEGFESGTLTQWTGTSTSRGEDIAVVSSSPLEGVYHAQFTSDGRSRRERAYVYKEISERMELYVRGYIQVHEGLLLHDRNDRFDLIEVSNRQGAHIASVTVQRDKRNEKWAIRSQSGTLYAASGPTEDRWYCIEFYTKIDESKGIHKLWVDGELLIDASELDTNDKGKAGTVQFGLTDIRGVNSVVQVYGDAFTILDTSPRSDDPSQDPSPTPEPEPSTEDPLPENYAPYLGFSGYVTSMTELDSTISVMKANGFNTYRISFRPSWQAAENSYHGYNEAYINRILDTTEFLVIVDGNHLYPPRESTALDAREHWRDVKNRIFQVLERYRNNPRVAVELINEYVSTDYNTRMQALITEIRDAGYTNMIVVNKWNTAWHKFTDPLEKTYQGYHYYFNSWSPNGAMYQMNIATALGIKIINTEIGASYNEYRDYTQRTVDETEEFMGRCTAIGASNLLWQNNNHDNWQTYVEYNLEVNTPPALVWN